MRCPKCKLINPSNALRCDCGWDFGSRTMEESYLPATMVQRPAIGGALILVGIGLIIVPVRGLMGLLVDLSQFSQATAAGYSGIYATYLWYSWDCWHSSSSAQYDSLPKTQTLPRRSSACVLQVSLSQDSYGCSWQLPEQMRW